MNLIFLILKKMEGDHLFEKDAGAWQDNWETAEEKKGGTPLEEETERIREAAQEIYAEYLDGFKDAILLLLSAKKEGKNCFIIFDGIPYYSVDIKTMDDAYLQRYWVSEADFRGNIDRL